LPHRTQNVLGIIGDGRRQLQALVRLRTIDHSSGPSLRCAEGHSPPLALRWDCDAEWTDAPNSPASPRPARNGTFTWKALRIEPNYPDRCQLKRGADHVGVHKKTWFWESCAA